MNNQFRRAMKVVGLCRQCHWKCADIARAFLYVLSISLMAFY